MSEREVWLVTLVFTLPFVAPLLIGILAFVFHPDGLTSLLP